MRSWNYGEKVSSINDESPFAWKLLMQGRPFFVSLYSKLFRKREGMIVGVWPALGLVIVVLLWVNTVDRIGQAKQEVEHQIRQHAAVAENSYAQQVHHMVSQIDHITLRLKYQ